MIGATLLLLAACKDDTVAPGTGNGNGNGNADTTCKLAQTIDTDGLKTTYTYNGDKLAKLVEDDDGEVTTHDFIYDNDKLVEIKENETYSYKLTYSNDQVTKVEGYDEGELSDVFEVEYNTDGTLKVVNEYIQDGAEAVLVARNDYTYANNDLKKISTMIDANDDGVLADTSDIVVETEILALDEKINPYYGMPIYFVEFSNFLALTKHNVNAATIRLAGTPYPITGIHTYNDHDYPVRSVITSGDSVVTEYTYVCE